MITAGDVEITAIPLGDINITNIWLGDALVWSHYKEPPHKLLDELGRGFRGVVGEHPEEGEKILQVDWIE